MKCIAAFFVTALFLAGAVAAQSVPSISAPASPGLLQIRRIYVAELTGGQGARALRELIISGINTTGLFVLTDNPDRADAVLKGAADDKVFQDTFDSSSAESDRENGSLSSGLLSNKIAGGIAAADKESHRIKERKHEAYATVRLCSHDGDVLWSTTQESLGAKFRGASVDVADKVARQLTLDVERARHGQPVMKSIN